MRANQSGAFFTFGTDALGFLLTGCLHPTVDTIGHFARQVCLTNTDIDDRNPRICQFIGNLFADIFHQFGPLA